MATVLELVSFDEARHQLRIDADDDSHDEWLALFIPSVSESVASWLKDRWRLYLPERDSNDDVVIDSDGVPVPAEDDQGRRIVHPIVRAAVLLELAVLFELRKGGDEHRLDGYTLSKAATNILTGLRKPTVQ